MEASSEGCVVLVKTLLKKGADVKPKDENGETALILASGEGHVDVVKALLDNGADVNAKDKDGRTALMRASTPWNCEAAKDRLEIDGMTWAIEPSEHHRVKE